MAESHESREEPPKHHFLVVVYPIQSHINPSLQLAKSLTRLGSRVTFSTAVSAHRRMFPENPTSLPLASPSDALLFFHPHSDGFDEGYNDIDPNGFKSTYRTIGSETIHAVATTPGQPPVTCIIYALLCPWVVDVASRLGIPSFQFWIQSAGTFLTYRECLRKNHDLSHTLELPGLPPLRRIDLPSFLVGGGGAKEAANEVILSLFKETLEAIEKGAAGDEKPRVIVDTFHELERDAIEGMREEVEIIPVGPVVPAVCLEGSGRKETAKFEKVIVKEATAAPEKEEYLGWLDKWSEGTVVYLSFGSLTVQERKQRVEIARAVVECGRPFLWVAREERDGMEEAEKVEHGKVVGWCEQVEVLKHKAVGCFVTHHGWNSTLEAIACGVPMVGLPQWTDQPTNARLAESLWRVGVRAEVNGDGVVEASELKRCLEAVMGNGQAAVELRERALMWKEKSREAAKEGGPSDRYLKAFVDGIRRRSL